MKHEQTLEKMKQMKFYGMTRAFSSTMEASNREQYTPDEMVAYLVDAEWDDRHNRKIDRYVRLAKFRYKSNIEQIYFDPSRNLDKNTMLRYAECDFIKKKENILITGSTGVGKSFIASAIGHQACLLGHKVVYYNTSKLFSKLKMAKADGSHLKEVSKIERQDLLILDDFGLQAMDSQSRSLFMEIIEDRYEKKSTIITSQIPVEKWYEVIGEKTIADAILDRLVHSSHRMELTGESMRRKKEIKENQQNMNEINEIM